MKPNFQITSDNGNKKLWVNSYNIWTLTEKECTPDVLEAIMHAYFLGAKAMKTEINQIELTGDLQSYFTHSNQ